MSASTCPDPHDLARLLAGTLPDGDRRELTGHLDGCAQCQLHLEKLAVGDTELAVAVKAAATESPPPSRSHYWDAIEELKQDVTPVVRSGRLTARLTSILLEFLEPTDTPGYLGRLAHFEVEKLLGRGGMGMVLRAFDTHLQRHVAIKVLDPQLADDMTARQRFCREARSAASITHENVVTIYHVEKEETSGLPFLVMQVVTGESLQDRLERHEGPLPVGDIVRIGLQTAVGLAAAHEKGLVHRDIKPANILLEANTDRVKLTDFGLARAAEDVRLTQTGFVTGTPLYMSPEQARGTAVDHRADLYSLGAVLYQMATGDPPFDGESPLALLRRVDQEDPIPVRDVNPAIPEPLARIIEHLLAKDPADRYQSAAEVAELLAHHLAATQTLSAPTAGLPRVHRRTGPLRRRRSPAERRWMTAALVGWGILAAVAVGLGITDAMGRTHLVASLFHYSPGEFDAADSPEPRLLLNGNAGPIWSAAFSPDRETVATGIDDGTVKVWYTDSRGIKRTINAHKSPIWRLAYDRDGAHLATASDDNTAKIWDTATWKLQLTLKHDTAVRAVAFAPDGQAVVTASRKGAVRVWDLATGNEKFETPGHDGVIYGLIYSPDGKMIASSGGDKVVRIWDAGTGQELITLRGHVGGVYAIAFSPDSKTIASGGWDKTVRLWDVATGSNYATLQGHTQDVWAVAFAPDGATLVSSSEDHTAKVWDVATRSLLATMRGSTGSLYTVAFAPDGHTFAAGGRDGIVRLWNWP